ALACEEPDAGVDPRAVGVPIERQRYAHEARGRGYVAGGIADGPQPAVARPFANDLMRSERLTCLPRGIPLGDPLVARKAIARRGHCGPPVGFRLRTALRYAWHRVRIAAHSLHCRQTCSSAVCSKRERHKVQFAKRGARLGCVGVLVLVTTPDLVRRAPRRRWPEWPAVVWRKSAGAAP